MFLFSWLSYHLSSTHIGRIILSTISIFLCCFYLSIFLPQFQIAKDEKESILASVPADLRDKGLELYTSLIDGKVLQKKEIISLRMENARSLNVMSTSISWHYGSLHKLFSISRSKNQIPTICITRFATFCIGNVDYILASK